MENNNSILKGKRPIIWVGAAIYNGQLFIDKFTVDNNITDLDVMRNDAKKLFLDKFKVEPTSLLGPFYDKKGELSTVTKNSYKKYINRDLTGVRFDAKNGPRPAVWG